MLFEQRDLYFTIEGIPKKGNTVGAVQKFSYGSGSLASLPPELNSSVNIANAQFNLSALNFSIPVTKYFIKMLFGGWREYGTELSVSSDISTGDTDISINSPDKSINIDDYIWIGNETLIVTNIDAQVGDRWDIVVNRAQADSDAESHIQGKDVYLEGPPFTNFRILKLYDVDRVSGAENIIWRGFVRHIDTDAYQNQLNIRASEAITTLFKNDIGLKLIGKKSNFKVLENGNFQNSIDIGDSWTTSRPRTDRNSVYIRIGETAYYGGINEEANKLNITKNQKAFNESPRLKSDDINEEDEVIIHAILADKDFTGIYGVNFTNDEGQQLPVASVALAILLSTGEGNNNITYNSTTYNFDVLSSDWGLGIPANLIDAESWIDAIDNNTKYLDHFVAGFDDGTYNINDVLINKLLYANNLFPAINNQGKLYIKDYDSMSIVETDQFFSGIDEYVAKITRNKINLTDDFGNNSRIIRANVGGAIPGVEEDKIKISNKNTGLRPDTSLNSGEVSIDLSYVSKINLGIPESDLLINLNDRLNKQNEARPVLSCEVPIRSYKDESTGAKYIIGPVGSLIEVRGGPNEKIFKDSREKGFIGPNGEFINLDDEEYKHIGRIIDKTINFEAGNVQLKILMINWNLRNLPRLIAPSGLLEDGVTTTTTHNILSNTEDLKSINDTLGFKSNDDVKVVNKYGRKAYFDDGSGIEITSVGASSITFDTSFPIPLGETYYVVIDDYDFFDNDWDTNNFYTDTQYSNRRYSFIADTASNLGSLNDEGDIYG